MTVNNWKQPFVVLIALMLIFETSIACDGFFNKTSEGGYIIRSVVIEGETNINHFRLRYSHDDEKGFSFKSADFKNNASNKVSFPIPVKDIKSDNRTIKKDFYDLVDASNHPNIVIELIQEDLYNIINQGKVGITLVDVIISGKKKSYITKINIAEEENKIVVIGKINLLLTDYGLNPPSKFFGLIKVKNEVGIDFIISFELN